MGTVVVWVWRKVTKETARVNGLRRPVSDTFIHKYLLSKLGYDIMSLQLFQMNKGPLEWLTCSLGMRWASVWHWKLTKNEQDGPVCLETFHRCLKCSCMCLQIVPAGNICTLMISWHPLLVASDADVAKWRGWGDNLIGSANGFGSITLKCRLNQCLWRFTVFAGIDAAPRLVAALNLRPHLKKSEAK